VPESCPVAWAFGRACRTATFAYLLRTSPRIGSRRHDIVVFTTPSRRLRVTFPSKVKDNTRLGVDCFRHGAYGVRCVEVRPVAALCAYERRA
jgi:hypothetical protein